MAGTTNWNTGSISRILTRAGCTNSYKTRNDNGKKRKKIIF